MARSILSVASVLVVLSATNIIQAQDAGSSENGDALEADVIAILASPTQQSGSPVK